MGSLLLTAIVILMSGILYWIHRMRHKFADKWPTMQPVYPLVGNALSVVGKNDVERFEMIERLFKSCDRIVKAWAGPKLFLLTSHPDLIQQILSSPVCLEKPFLYRFAGFEQGLFTAKYHVWKETRKQLNTTFNQRILHGFIPIYVKCAKRMVESLNQFADGATVNIHKYTALCTLEMACETNLGSQVFKREGKLEFERGLDQAFNGASKRMISVHLYPDFLYRLTKYYKELMNARKTVCDFFTELVVERRDYLTSQCNRQDEYKKPMILIDHLLSVSHKGKSFSETQITDNIYAVITGATDTTSLVTAHACLFLSYYPDIQERLFAEIIDYFPTDSLDLDCNPEAIKALKYMEMFLNEVQRHWSVVPSIARQNVSEIEIDGIKVPPGNLFVMSLYSLHKRQDFWGPDADRFDPENFSDARMKGRHPFAFLPFSGGNRICLGWRYAMFSMKVTMMHLVRSFKFSTKIRQEDIRFRHDLTLKLPFEHLVEITKRNP